MKNIQHTRKKVSIEKKKRVKRKRSSRNISTRNGKLTSRLKVSDFRQAKETKALTPPLIDLNKTLKQENEDLPNVYFKKLPVKILNEENINIHRFKNDNIKNVEVKSFNIENNLPKISTITDSMLNNFPRYNSANFISNFDSGNTNKSENFVEEFSKKQASACIIKPRKTINYSDKKTKINCLYNSNENRHKHYRQFGNKNSSKTFKEFHVEDDNKKQEIIILKDCSNKKLSYFCKELAYRICIEAFKSSRTKEKNKKCKSVRLIKNVIECSKFLDEIYLKKQSFSSFKNESQATLTEENTQKKKLNAMNDCNNITHKKREDNFKPWKPKSFTDLKEQCINTKENDNCRKNIKPNLCNPKKDQVEVKRNTTNIFKGVK